MIFIIVVLLSDIFLLAETVFIEQITQIFRVLSALRDYFEEILQTSLIQRINYISGFFCLMWIISGIIEILALTVDRPENLHWPSTSMLNYRPFIICIVT